MSNSSENWPRIVPEMFKPKPVIEVGEEFEPFRKLVSLDASEERVESRFSLKKLKDRPLRFSGGSGPGFATIILAHSVPETSAESSTDQRVAIFQLNAPVRIIKGRRELLQEIQQFKNHGINLSKLLIDLADDDPGNPEIPSEFNLTCVLKYRNYIFTAQPYKSLVEGTILYTNWGNEQPDNTVQIYIPIQKELLKQLKFTFNRTTQV